jgi:CheY-like chemotaxis protein
MEELSVAQKNIGGAYCYRVKGLFVPYETPPSIDQDINNYIGKIGQYTERLEDSFNRKDKNGFIHVLEKIIDILQAVYAKQGVSYANALMDAAKNRNLEYCERLLQQAIADFLLLSIEMQKAQKLNTSHAMKYRDVEKNEEIARGLAAVSRSIASGNYERAESMASDLTNLDNTFVKLVSMCKAQQYGRAKELADTMEKEHIGLIQRGGIGKVSKTVLAVDDRPEILANVSAALRGHYKVIGAPGGKMALELMKRYKIDLFYLDIDMPEMDGFELTGRIRADSLYAKTPIIFLTGNASKEHIARAICLGIDDFIVKPSNHVNLLVKARKYMDEQ